MEKLRLSIGIINKNWKFHSKAEKGLPFLWLKGSSVGEMKWRDVTVTSRAILPSSRVSSPLIRIGMFVIVLNHSMSCRCYDALIKPWFKSAPQPTLLKSTKYVLYSSCSIFQIFHICIYLITYGISFFPTH